jgi:hypothetical protein
MAEEGVAKWTEIGVKVHWPSHGRLSVAILFIKASTT